MISKRTVLIVATTAYMIRQFNMENIKLLQNLGFTVEIACNFIKGNPISLELIEDMKSQLDQMGVTMHQIPIVKSPLNLKLNIQAYQLLLKLIRERTYAFVHCQTPVGAVLARIAAHKAQVPNIYMAHGFHFYKGAGFFTWLKYYPVEWLLSSVTDVLILINAEDYYLASHKMKAKRNIYVPGIGIDISAFEDADSAHQISKDDLGITADAIIILSVGELNKNKNHELILRLLPELPTFHYLIAGEGSLKQQLIHKAEKLGVRERVSFLGYIKDIKPIYRIADIYCHPSHREGLPVAVMEAMASGLPIVGYDIRGNRDLVDQQKGGILIPHGDQAAYSEALKILSQNPGARREMGSYNREKIKAYSSARVNLIMKDVFSKFKIFI